MGSDSSNDNVSNSTGGSRSPSVNEKIAATSEGCPVKGEKLPSTVKSKNEEECPVKHQTSPSAPNHSFSVASFLGNFNVFNLFTATSTTNSQTPPSPIQSPLITKEANVSPNVNASQRVESCGDSGYNVAANDLHFGHQPQPGQKLAMSQSRTVSTIPKSDFTPAHQPNNIDKWVYPSEQQYYNAMKRKGYSPAEEDVAVVLAIHNVVNEKGWSQIKQWEALRGCSTPKLKQFLGRPQDISPKAYLMNLMGYALPFDRHDWVVDSNGKDVRYVIDFYKGKESPAAPISMHLDVRPAIDNPYALYHRFKFNIFELLNVPKITSNADSELNTNRNHDTK